MIKVSGSPVTISIDQKKKRIRIYKSMLQLLDFPQYIQLLVNPNNKYVAIKAIGNPTSDDQAERIKPQELMVNDSYELYSKAFVEKLCKVDSRIEPKYTYRLTGKIVPSHQMAIFSLETLTRVDV